MEFTCGICGAFRSLDSKVLLVVVGVREGVGFEVLGWRAAAVEPTEDNEELLIRLRKRGLECVELIVSAGLSAIVSAAQIVYPASRHQRCLAHWFRNWEALTPRFTWFERRKFRREFWWIWKAENQTQARDWARRLCARWRWATSKMVEKFQFELEQVRAFFRFQRTGQIGYAPPTWARSGSNICAAT
jgi:putative transposase